MNPLIDKLIQFIPVSWRTSFYGIAGIGTAIFGAARLLFDGDPTTNPDWVATWSAITLGFGLLMARDHKVSSEKAGAK